MLRKSVFETQQKMHLDLKAANEFEVEDQELAAVFDERNRSVKEYGPLFEGMFRPYIPSEGIIEKFARKSEEFQRSNPGYENPFEGASDTIAEMINQFSGADLSKGFDFNLSDFTSEMDKQIELEDAFDPFSSSSLPPTPMPNQQVVQTATAMPAAGAMNQGLTPTENALYSEEEKQITLRNRGLA